MGCHHKNVFTSFSMLYIKKSLKIQVINHFSIIAKHIIIHLYVLAILKLKIHCQDIFIVFRFLYILFIYLFFTRVLIPSH